MLASGCQLSTRLHVPILVLGQVDIPPRWTDAVRGPSITNLCRGGGMSPDRF